MEIAIGDFAARADLTPYNTLLFQKAAERVRKVIEKLGKLKYKLIIEAQSFHNATPDDLTYSLRRDSFLQIELRRYF